MNRINNLADAGIDVCRSNSPYDYHPVKDAPTQPTQSANLTPPHIVETSPSPDPQIAMSTIDYTSTTTTTTTTTETDIIAPAPIHTNATRAADHLGHLCPPYCGTNVGGNANGNGGKSPNHERQKHLWYCQHCLIMDEAAGANDPWGFSSTRTSRTESPEDSEDSPKIGGIDAAADAKM